MPSPCSSLDIPLLGILKSPWGDCSVSGWLRVQGVAFDLIYKCWKAEFSSQNLFRLIPWSMENTQVLERDPITLCPSPCQLSMKKVGIANMKRVHVPCNFSLERSSPLLANKITTPITYCGYCLSDQMGSPIRQEPEGNLLSAFWGGADHLQKGCS